jgi:transcriptional regulator with XRE-family HTH domain
LGRSSHCPYGSLGGMSEQDGATELVAAEIRAEMARQRVSHADVAAKLGVSRPWLSRRLSGDTSMSVDDVAKIAEALGVPLAQFTAPIDNHTNHDHH